MGLRMFLLNWERFAAKTESEIVLECFCGFGVGLRIFRQGRTRRRGILDLEVFCVRREGKRKWT